MKIKKLILFVILIATVSLISTESAAHESGQFKHIIYPSGSIIGHGFCPESATFMWPIDNNGDGIIDECKQNFVDHGEYHVATLPPSDRDWETY